MSERPLLLVVAGPTACGKSDLAVELSESSGSPRPEILNFDSIQFFDGVEIGAAKPPADLLKRATHHLIGHMAKGSVYTAGDFRRDALKIIDERAKAGVNRFICVGGSGFYIQALERGMYEAPASDPQIRADLEAHLEAHGSEALHEELKSRDPETAAKIHVNDHYRIVRALEILRYSGGKETLSEIRAKFLTGSTAESFRFAKIGVFRNRETLRQKVTERVRKMMGEGLIEEVQRLREEGLRDWAPLSSVGYKEVQQYLDGALSRDLLEDAIVTSTMQLAKRQMTWFRRDPEITWFDSDENWPAARSFGEKILNVD